METQCILYSLDDVAIIPCAVSKVNSRSECNIYDENSFLPIFTSPMPSVLNDKNEQLFRDNGIHSIIPRSVSYEVREAYMDKGIWVALSLKEFEEKYLGRDLIRDSFSHKVLIDVANGNMYSLHLAISIAKKKYGKSLTIMAGNIASPESFCSLGKTGVDYIRLSVGTGSACITSTNTGIYYPMASLIKDCFYERLYMDNKPKIIADGGLSNYRDIIKCYALGADYVMLGSMLAKLEESSGEIVMVDDKQMKVHYGMASHDGQMSLGKKILQVPEGKVRYISIDGTISSFIEEFSFYLKSSMSYCGVREFSDFVGKQNLAIISNSSQKQFNQNNY